MTNAAVEAAGPEIETFATPAGRFLGYFFLGAALVLSVLSLRSQGTDAFGLIGVCVTFSALSWVVLIRPRVTAHQNGLMLRNMLRDTFVPWATIKSCRVAQTLQIGTRDKVYHGLGITKSARQVNREERKRGGGGRGRGRKAFVGPNLGFGSMVGSATTDTSPEDQQIADKARGEQTGGSYFTHTEQRIETLAKKGAAETAEAEPKIAWDPLSFAGLVVAVLGIILAVFS